MSYLEVCLFPRQVCVFSKKIVLQSYLEIAVSSGVICRVLKPAI